MIRFATGMAGRASRTLLGSFGALIVLGTVLLSLPYATPRGGLPIIEALFMATSAVCVTGLTVMDVGAELTLYGQGVVLALIQLGALGLMTFSTVFFMMLGRSIPFVSRTVARETLTSSGGSEVRSLIRSVVIFTLLFEMAGTAAFYFMFRRDQTAVVAFKNAVFHSVSAFCNAGFPLFSDSFVRWQSDSGMNTILISLIVCGGLGFVTLVDLWKWFSSRAMALIETARGRAGFLIERRALSVHSRMVLTVTAVAIVAGTLIFWLSPGRGPRGGASNLHFLEAFFLSITARTAGFKTISTASLGDASIVFLLMLMFMGASPGSTGGGVKTTTVGILLGASWDRLRGRGSTSLFRRTIPEDILRRAGSIIILGGHVVLLFLFVLLAVEAGNSALTELPRRFLAILFEVISAFGTVGLSMGVTKILSPAGLLLLSALMFIGRLGPLTLALAVTHRPLPTVRHPEEQLMVG